MNLYVIYDRVAEQGSSLFEAVNDGVAMREFTRFKQKLTVDPSEYWLLHVGVYTQNPICVVGCEPRQVVGVVADDGQLELPGVERRAAK